MNPIIRNVLFKMIRWPLNSPMNRIIRNLWVPRVAFILRDNERIERVYFERQ